MIVTDPIADMLTRIRNALVAKHDTVEVPASNMKKAIADVYKRQGLRSPAAASSPGGRRALAVPARAAPALPSGGMAAWYLLPNPGATVRT